MNDGALLSLIALSGLTVVVAILRAAYVGVRAALAWRRKPPGEVRHSIMLLGLNMLEPLLTTGLNLTLIALMAYSWMSDDFSILISAFAWHILLLLLPVSGLGKSTPFSNFNLALIWRGAQRIGSTIVIVIGAFILIPSNAWYIVPILLLAGTMLLWLQTSWASRQLEWLTNYAPSASSRPI